MIDFTEAEMKSLCELFVSALKMPPHTPIALPASRFLALKKAERNADAGHGTIRGRS
jgi:hypothetical protein